MVNEDLELLLFIVSLLKLLIQIDLIPNISLLISNKINLFSTLIHIGGVIAHGSPTPTRLLIDDKMV